MADSRGRKRGRGYQISTQSNLGGGREPLLKEARALFLQERFDDLTKVLVSTPVEGLTLEEQVERLYLLGLCAATEGDHPAAEYYYRDALARCGNIIDPGEVQYSLCVNLSMQGRFEEALDFGLRAWKDRGVHNADNHGQIAWMIGVIYFRLKQDNAAVQWLKASIKIWGRWNPESADAYYYLGVLAMVREDWNVAARHLTRARFLYPRGTSCYRDADVKLNLVTSHIRKSAGYTPYLLYGGGIATALLVLSGTRMGLAGGAGIAGLGASVVWGLNYLGLL